MDPSTRLRRQFRERSKDPMSHLLFRGKLYHYHRRVPAVVRTVDPSLPEAIRRSTGTDRLKEAQAIVREWAEADEENWLKLLTGKAEGPWLVALRQDRDLTLDKAREVIERRADDLRVSGVSNRQTG